MKRVLFGAAAVIALAGAGFDCIEAVDLTEVAIESSVRIENALDRSHEEIVAAAGSQVLQGWQSVGRVYLQAFEERKLQYLFVTAKKPYR